MNKCTNEDRKGQSKGRTNEHTVARTSKGMNELTSEQRKEHTQKATLKNERVNK